MLPAGFSRYPVWRRWFGRRSERAVAKYLRRKGYRILGQNIDDGRGEIDLLALEGNVLVVVEVRSSETRTCEELGATIDEDKQRRLTNAMLRFCQRRELWDVGVRFDVVAVRWPATAKTPEIRHYTHAFEAVGKYQFRS